MKNIVDAYMRTLRLVDYVVRLNDDGTWEFVPEEAPSRWGDITVQAPVQMRADMLKVKK